VNKTPRPKKPAKALHTVPIDPPERNLLEPQMPTHRRLWRVIKWVLGGTISLLGLLGTIYGLWGPPWPTEPSYAPGVPSFSSPFDVPFIVTNKSALFTITNLQISCQLDDVVVSFPTAPNNMISDSKSTISASNILAPLETRSYTCPIRGFSMSGPMSVADAKIRRATVSFVSTYNKRIFSGLTSSKSDVFTLNTRTSPPQWTVGQPLR
jgi:hypothetical protein